MFAVRYRRSTNKLVVDSEVHPPSYDNAIKETEV
jgi:hypothetical protein